MPEISHRKRIDKRGWHEGEASEVPRAQNLRRPSLSGLCEITWIVWKHKRWDAEAA